MTATEKQQIISSVTAVLSQMLIVEAEHTEAPPQTEKSRPVEMLSIKECAETIPGLTEHTLRNMINDGKIPYIRTGKGKKGKILVSKAVLIDFLNKST